MKKRHKLFLQVLIGISLAAAFSAATIAQPEEIGNEAKNPLSVSDIEARLKSLLEERAELVTRLQSTKEEMSLQKKEIALLLHQLQHQLQRHLEVSQGELDESLQTLKTLQALALKYQ